VIDIAFIGLGTMGNHMARNLAKAGYRLTLFDIDKTRVAELADELGAVAGASNSDAALSEIIVLMLPNSGVVRAVLGDPSDCTSLAGRLGPRNLVVDMGSSDPRSTQWLARQLGDRGARLIDAPVSGGPRLAATAGLTIMVGGDPECVAAAHPILAALGTTIRATGSVGSGHALKALNNLLSAIGLVGALEVLAIGIKFGLDKSVMLEVINASTGRNQATEVKIAQQVFSGDYNVGFSLQLAVKDVSTALDLARSEGVVAPVGTAALDVCREALALDNAFDQSEIARLIERSAGVTFADHELHQRNGIDG